MDRKRSQTVFSKDQGRQTDPGMFTSNSLSKSVGSERHRYRSEGDQNSSRPITTLVQTGVSPVQPKHIRKVAVTGQGPTVFYMLNQNRPLAGIIQDICDKWSIPNPDDKALQFEVQKNVSIYITERNRADIQNGNVLQLIDSPGRAAQLIIDKLKDGGREEKIKSLEDLVIKAGDPTFAQEFISKSGLKLIIDYVIAGNKMFSNDPLRNLLRSFVALMEHNVVSWDILEPSFTKQVAECVSGARAAGEGCIQPSLEILENVILHSNEHVKSKTLDHYVTPDKIFPYIASKNAENSRCALALINAMFIKSPPDKKKALADSFQTKHFRGVITNDVLGKLNVIGPEMAHQLYKLQRLMLNMYEGRMNTPVDHKDTEQVTQVHKNIEDLRRIAFDFTDPTDAASNRKSAVAKDYKKLGFKNQTSPLVDFEEAPPGLMALDNMVYFAQVHKEQYIKVVLENCGRANEQDCPFVQASIQLTKILCNLLKIGEDPYDDEHSYYPMFFSADKPVEEFFSACIQTLNRTWKEMRASKEDIPKVLSVVNEQITRALEKNCDTGKMHKEDDKDSDRNKTVKTTKSFDIFKSNLAALAYPELKKLWEAERHKKDQSKAQAKPILELREMIKPDILELIRKQRLLYLEGGSRFPKFDNKGNRTKNKYQYWRLAPNHKALHFADCTENGELSIEQLPNKVVVLEIKELQKKKECPHIKNAPKKTQSEHAFSITLEGSRPDEETYHCFMASKEQEYNMWIDGLDALLNNRMSSKQTYEDLETLLNMEIKLRLLETEGITIPKEPPPIPALPDNFNFAYTIA